MQRFISAIVLACFSILVRPASPESADLKISATPDRATYAPGDTAVIALAVTIPDKFHLYGSPLGPGIGKPLSLSLKNQSTGARFLKSAAKKYQPLMGDWVWAYEQEAWFFIKLPVPASAAGPFTETAVLSGLICHTSCIPVTRETPFTVTPGTSAAFGSSWNKTLSDRYAASEPLPAETENADGPDQGESGGLSLSLDGLDAAAAQEEEIPEWNYTPVEKKTDMNIILAILFALLAGLILNVMPCVLPVLGVKILSFTQHTGSRRSAIVHSLAFSAGMVFIFLLLGTLAAFAGYSWGQQFQNPKTLVAIICIIFVFALGMFDVFMILVPSRIGAIEQKSGAKGLLGDFVKGMVATIMATPCSGPFLGATLAWTLTQKPLVIYAIFASVGIGMASPYIVLSASKTLLKLMPKPGNWMEDFKHVMGFFLIGFAVYLMIGLPKDMVVSTVGLCVFLALAVGSYGRLAPFGSAVARKMTAAAVTLAIAAAGWYLAFGVLYAKTSDQALKTSAKDAVTWQPFTASRLVDAHDNGRNAIVDFTANWCMNCQYNMIAVLHSKEINDLIVRRNITPLVADLTSPQPVAESLMHQLGSRSVPFLAIFPADDPYNPVIMRDLLDKKKLAAVLEKLPE